MNEGRIKRELKREEWYVFQQWWLLPYWLASTYYSLGTPNARTLFPI